MSARYPERIVCLTDETTEILYLLGEEHRIVGISGYTVRPARARREKPRISAFTSARIECIVELRPDLVLGFSDLQADIAQNLIRRGIPVMVFNQRSVQEILNTILTLGGMVGATQRAELLVRDLEARLNAIGDSAARFTVRPSVYFEEWDEPMISGIHWVSELVSIAGGRDCFAGLAQSPLAKSRIIGDPADVVRQSPDIIVASWCGKKFRPEKMRERPGWSGIPAVSAGHLYEIKSCNILQPGPAALTDGVQQLHDIVLQWQHARSDVDGSSFFRPAERSPVADRSKTQ